mgnify:CR=1 FL=1
MIRKIAIILILLSIALFTSPLLESSTYGLAVLNRRMEAKTVEEWNAYLGIKLNDSITVKQGCGVVQIGKLRNNVDSKMFTLVRVDDPKVPGFLKLGLNWPSILRPGKEAKILLIYCACIPGAYKIRLKIFARSPIFKPQIKIWTDVREIEVRVENDPPRVRILRPRGRSPVKVNQTITFVGNYTDAGPLDKHTIEWRFGDGATAKGTLTPTHRYTKPGTYRVELIVRDNYGGVGRDNIHITVVESDKT